MVNRDVARSITIEQLKQQYNLDNKKTAKALEQQSQNLIKVENELNNYIETTTKEIELIQDQVDGNITTWFFDGVPTLDNKPATDWATEEAKTNHLGDLYYDSLTGYAYRFSLENEEFLWHKLTDSDVTEALALANTAKDTADSKRRVFVTSPTTPYDSGDFWINNNEIFICQVGRENGDFVQSDFINSLKYTDDTFAQEVDNKLIVVSGKVTTIEKGIDEINTNIENNKYFVDSDGNKQLISEQMTNVTQNLEGIEVSISNLDTNLEENYYQKEDVEQLILNSESGITNIFSKSGGSNLLRNTGVWYGEDVNWDCWEGNVKRIDERESITGYAFSLQNGITKQTVQLSDGNYSISFKYRRLLDVANAKVRYNNREIILEEEGTIQTTGLVNTKSFCFEMECDTNDGYEIYEIMLNHGNNIYLPWAQSPNEVKTTNVNISENITVESNTENTKTTLGANGLVGQNKNTSEVVFKQTEEGSYSKFVEADKGLIGGLSINRVENQTWITGV